MSQAVRNIVRRAFKNDDINLGKYYIKTSWNGECRSDSQGKNVEKKIKVRIKPWESPMLSGRRQKRNQKKIIKVKSRRTGKQKLEILSMWATTSNVNVGQVSDQRRSHSLCRGYQ